MTLRDMEDEVIAHALRILKRRSIRHTHLTDPTTVRKYLTVEFSYSPYEAFWVVFLDTRHRVISIEELFKGTLDGASVYPREVVRAALKHNAGAVIFAHNHPSGVAEPSQADRCLTDRLKSALELIGVRVLDHFVCAGADAISFAERGYL